MKIRKIQSRFIVLGISILVFGTFFSFDARVANDFPLISQESLLGRFSIPQVWTTEGAVGMGEYAVALLWGWPLNFLYGVGAVLGLNFAVLERLLGILAFLLIGSYSIDRLLKSFNLSKEGIVAGSLLYMLNSYILLIIDGGQLNIALAYAIFPLVFQLLKEAIKEGTRKKVLTGILISVLGIFDIRFIYLLAIVTIVHLFFELLTSQKKELKTNITRAFSTAVIVGIIFVGLNMYWLLTALFASAPSLPAGYDRVDQASNLSFATIGHSLLLLSPHWYKNVFGEITTLLPLLFGIPLVAFVAPLLAKSKAIAFWLVITLTGIFLVKGNNPPFSDIYTFIFQNVPGFSLFRDPTKFYFLVALAYAVLVSFTFNRFRKASYLFVLYLLIIAIPVWSNNMTGIFSSSIYTKEYENVNTIIQEDTSFGRVLYLPSRASLGHASPQHPSVEMSRLISDRNFAIGTVGSYEVFNSLRETPYMDDILSIYGIKYLVYPFLDERRDDLKQDNVDYYYTFSSQLARLPFTDQLNGAPVSLYKMQSVKDRFFTVDNSWLVLGEDRFYEELDNHNISISENALIFVENGNLEQVSQGNVILYNKTNTDLVASLLDRSKYISPAISLDFSPNETGWWKREAMDLIWWRNFLQQKYSIDNLDFDYGMGWSVAEGGLELTIDNEKFEENKILLARVMKGSRGGEVVFKQNDVEIGRVNTYGSEPEIVTQSLEGNSDVPDMLYEYDKANFNWYNIGELNSSDPVTLVTTGEINVVNTLVSITQEEWNDAQSKSTFYSTVSWKDLSNDQKQMLFADSQQNVQLEYQRLSPTHYKLSVTGVKRPTTIVFSETYNSFWEINGEKGFPVYSNLNGFTVKTDGNYEIYFTAQKYVLPGLIVSGVTAMTLIAYLAYTSHNGKRHS